MIDLLLVDANLFGSHVVLKSLVVKAISLKLMLRVLHFILLVFKIWILSHLLFIPFTSFHNMRVLTMFAFFYPTKPAEHKLAVRTSYRVATFVFFDPSLAIGARLGISLHPKNVLSVALLLL